MTPSSQTSTRSTSTRSTSTRSTITGPPTSETATFETAAFEPANFEPANFESATTDTLDLVALHARLTARAQSEGLLDVAYTTIDSPLGTLLLAATPEGLVRVAFASEGHDHVLEILAGRLSSRILRAPQRLDGAAHQLDEYFTHRRTAFDLPLDLSLSHGFGRLVQQQLPTIAYGQTRTYRDVAELVGRPTATRAVGTACATNPLPVVVPCHRVVRSDGTLGGYLGGLDAKSALLDLERGDR